MLTQHSLNWMNWGRTRYRGRKPTTGSEIQALSWPNWATYSSVSRETGRCCVTGAARLQRPHRVISTHLPVCFAPETVGNLPSENGRSQSKFERVAALTLTLSPRRAGRGNSRGAPRTLLPLNPTSLFILFAARYQSKCGRSRQASDSLPPPAGTTP